MKEIELTQGQKAIVDDEDYEMLSKIKWHTKKSRSNYYARFNKKRKPVYMHSLIMKPPKGMHVDHINHNGLDNRKENLRICTNKENARNRIGRGLSKYLGVWWSKERNKWIAQIGKKKLGRFQTEEEAAMAYNKKAIEMYGEYANLNIIQ